MPTATRVLDKMPLPGNQAIRRGTHIRPGEAGQPRSRVAVALRVAAELGVEVPDAVRTEFDRANALRLTRIDARDADVRRAAALRLAHGSLTVEEALNLVVDDEAVEQQALDARRAQRELLRRAADTAYKAAVDALRMAAASLVEQLGPVLDDVLDEQAKTRRFENPLARRRFDQVHELGAGLRWATGSIDISPSSDWWRYRSPEAVWLWKIGQLDGDRNAKFRFAGVGTTPDGHPCRFIEADVSIGLDVIASHRAEWVPAVVSAEQVLEHSAELESEWPRA